MNLIGSRVAHKKFGKGTIIEGRDWYIVVRFDDAYTARFVYPSCFERYLEPEDPDAAAWVAQALQARKNGRAEPERADLTARLRSASPRRRYALPESAMRPNSYWALLRNARLAGMCTQVACTTCGCMPFREYVRDIGWDKVAELLNEVTLQEIASQYDLRWHDALEIMLCDHDPEPIMASVIYREYLFVFEEYYRLRRLEHVRIPEARRLVIKAVQDKKTDI